MSFSLCLSVVYLCPLPPSLCPLPFFIYWLLCQPVFLLPGTISRNLLSLLLFPVSPFVSVHILSSSSLFSHLSYSHFPLLPKFPYSPIPFPSFLSRSPSPVFTRISPLPFPPSFHLPLASSSKFCSLAPPPSSPSFPSYPFPNPFLFLLLPLTVSSYSLVGPSTLFSFLLHL